MQDGDSDFERSRRCPDGDLNEKRALLLVMPLFVLVVDTSIMNVSISVVVRDIGTTDSGPQTAIALEALVSAAFILIGGKIGAIGRKCAYVLGLLVPQMNNSALSPISEARISQAAGVNPAVGSFGLSFGLAFAGAIMPATLSLALTALATSSTLLPAQKKKQVAPVMSNIRLEEILAGQPKTIRYEIVRINTDARPFALHTPLFSPTPASLGGLILSFRMAKTPHSQSIGHRRWSGLWLNSKRPGSCDGPGSSPLVAGAGRNSSPAGELEFCVRHQSCSKSPSSDEADQLALRTIDSDVSGQKKEWESFMSIGPVEVLVCAFPKPEVDMRVIDALSDVVKSGAVALIDLVLVSRDEEGAVSVRDLEDELPADWPAIIIDSRPLTLLSDADLEVASGAIGNGETALVVAIENLWAQRLAEEIRGSDGVVALHARIPYETVVSAIEVDSAASD